MYIYNTIQQTPSFEMWRKSPINKLCLHINKVIILYYVKVELDSREFIF